MESLVPYFISMLQDQVHSLVLIRLFTHAQIYLIVYLCPYWGFCITLYAPGPGACLSEANADDGHLQ